MKKITIFLALFIGVFCLMSNFAQAETKTLTIPLGQKPEEISLLTPVGNFIQQIKQLFLLPVLAETASKDVNLYCRKADGSDSEFKTYFDFTTNEQTCISKSGKADINMRCNQDECFPVPAPNAYTCGGKKWKITSASVTTTSMDDTGTGCGGNHFDDYDQCMMALVLTKSMTDFTEVASSVGWTECASSWSHGNSWPIGQGNAGSSSVPSGAGFVWGRLRATGGSLFGDEVFWTGQVTLQGQRPSFDSFTITAKRQGQTTNSTISAGQSMTVCKGENLRIDWGSSNSNSNVLYVGGTKEHNSGETLTVNQSGNINRTASITTGAIFIVKGYAGEAFEETFKSDSLSVIVVDCVPADVPAVNLSANPVNIHVGEASTLSWNSQNVSFCTASSVPVSGVWSGSKPTSGSQSTGVLNVAGSYKYNLACNGTLGSASGNITVVVSTPPPPECDTNQNVEGGHNANDTCKNLNVGRNCCHDIDSNNPGPGICEVCGAGPVDVGDLTIKVRLNGVEVTTPTDVRFDIKGNMTFEKDKAPITVRYKVGTYIVKYVSGGPAGSTFLGYSPYANGVVPVTKNQTTTIFLDFSDAGRCDITVQALKYDYNSSSPTTWMGPLSYGLIGPIILNGTAVEQVFENVPVGRYYLTSLVGGPGIYSGVTPTNPISCPSNGEVTLVMKFKDPGPGNSYKCNYSTGRCDVCDTYSEECKYNSLSACNMECTGCTGSHVPKANVFCWANFDSESEPCVGMNDNVSTTPSVILYDKSTDSCGDTKKCTWEIFNSSGTLLKTVTAKACAPYPWYDETPGIYKAKLTIEDNNGSSFVEKKFEIRNVKLLTCNFAWDPNAPTVSGATSFFDQTLTPNGTTLKYWKWTFTGASIASSTARTVENVIFNSAGIKKVTLTVKNSANETCSLEKEITVKTINPYWNEVVPF